MFFASSTVPPQIRESVGAIEDSGANCCWGEQVPDLVTAASCMESFMDLNKYCNTSAFTEQPEGELNTPVVEFAKEPNFNIPSRTVPGNDSGDYSWGVTDNMGLREIYDIETCKQTEESNNPAEEMEIIISDNNNNDDNNNNNVRRDYTANGQSQFSVHFTQDVTFNNATMPIFTKSEVTAPETYTTTTGDELFLMVDREEVVPLVAEEVIVKNEGWLQPPTHATKSGSNRTTSGTAKPGESAPARRRPDLKVEIPRSGVHMITAQVTPVSASGDLFQSVPQDFDLMKFLLEEGIPEGVPDPLAALCPDSRVPEFRSSGIRPIIEQKISIGKRDDFVEDNADNREEGEEGITSNTVESQEEGSRHGDTRGPDNTDSKDGDHEQEKLQLVIRKTNSPDSGDSPSYTVIQRPQRAASKRVLEAIKKELKDDCEDDELSDDSEDGDEYEPESSEGRSTSGRKRQAPRRSRREREQYEPPRQRRRTTSTSSVDDTPTRRRYRELRDKNNEASRRSRENRKLREAEMQEQRERLERENARLRVRAEELERLVDALRKALVAAVSTSASKRGSAEVED